jgi:hypothetical protein
MAEEHRDDKLVEDEEDAAREEAAGIGGRSGMEGLDEADRPVAEAGGGEAEGFEEAEKLLEEEATHGGPGGNPLSDASAAEAEEGPAVYGEADHLDSTETDEDAP